MTEAERVDVFNRILDQELVFKLFFKPAQFFFRCSSAHSERLTHSQVFNHAREVANAK